LLTRCIIICPEASLINGILTSGKAIEESQGFPHGVAVGWEVVAFVKIHCAAGVVGDSRVANEFI